MSDIVYRPIGRISSSLKTAQGSPIQPSGARGQTARLEVAPAFREGLADLDGFSHLIILYHFHLSEGFKLKIKPFLDPDERGVFATRAPKRPNSIGLSVVRLEKVTETGLDLLDVDILDNTPVLDIKPFVPEFDVPPGEIKTGWLNKTADEARDRKADGRFGDRER